MISTVRNGRDVLGKFKHIFYGGTTVQIEQGTQAVSTGWKPIQYEQSMEDGWKPVKTAKIGQRWLIRPLKGVGEEFYFNVKKLETIRKLFEQVRDLIICTLCSFFGLLQAQVTEAFSHSGGLVIKLWAELVSPEVSLLGFSPATDGHLLPVSLHMFFPVCTSLCPTLLFS